MCLLRGLVLSVALLVGTPALANAAAARADFLPYEGPKPVLVWIQTDPWLMVIGSDTPRVVLYDDGELLFLKEEKRKWSYRHRRLQGDELGHLRSRLAAVAALDHVKPTYDVAPNVTDQPETLLYVHSGQREVVTRIYGLMVKGTRLLASTSFPGKRSPDSPPEEVVELHRFLASLTDSEGTQWKPRYLEVMIWPYEYAPEESIKWPANWPGLNSDRTVKRREGSYSIFLDAALESELVNFLSKRKKKGAIEIGGKKWAASVRPVFPSEPVWRKAFGEAATR